MAQARKVIVSCAITGSIHTPSMSAHLPVTAEEIAQSAIGAAEAGAAVVHLHARDPTSGRPAQDPERFTPFVTAIKGASDVVINITTGGSMTMTVDDRLRAATSLKPELASLNMGTMNFGLFPMAGGRTEFTRDWEVPYLEASRSGFFRNTFADIEQIVEACSANGTRFEFECYDIGHLYTLAHFADRQLVRPPFFVQGVFGILGGIGAHPQDVATMKSTADRLFGDALVWSALGAGRNQMAVASISVAMGGHVRVGLEDSLWLRPGQMARSNAEQVSQVCQIVEGIGCSVATPEETRAILKLGT